MEQKFCTLICMKHESEDLLYPVRIKNRDTGVCAFRVAKSGNSIDDSLEITDEKALIKYVRDLGYSVRASTMNKSRGGLYRLGQRSIVGVSYRL
jgi:hypothetical protein